MNTKNIRLANESKTVIKQVALDGIENALHRDAISGTQWFDANLKTYARTICNGCGSEIGTAQMNDFFRNDGYCNHCNQ